MGNKLTGQELTLIYGRWTTGHGSMNDLFSRYRWNRCVTILKCNWLYCFVSVTSRYFRINLLFQLKFPLLLLPTRLVKTRSSRHSGFYHKKIYRWASGIKSNGVGLLVSGRVGLRTVHRAVLPSPWPVHFQQFDNLVVDKIYMAAANSLAGTLIEI